MLLYRELVGSDRIWMVLNTEHQKWDLGSDFGGAFEEEMRFIYLHIIMYYSTVRTEYTTK